MKTLTVIYQIALVIMSLILVYAHRTSIFGTKPTSIDVLLLTTAIVSFFFPLTKEISLGGLSLKKEIENTKTELTDKLSQVRNEIVSSIAVSPTFNVGMQPLTDDALKKLEDSLQQSVNKAFNAFAPESSQEKPEISVEKDTLYLFSVRNNIEKELRRIWGNRDLKDSRWPTTVHYMSSNLSKAEVIPGYFVNAIKEVYNVCSPAIHGENVTPQQMAFVNDLAPRILTTLRNIN